MYLRKQKILFILWLYMICSDSSVIIDSVTYKKKTYNACNLWSVNNTSKCLHCILLIIVTFIIVWATIMLTELNLVSLSLQLSIKSCVIVMHIYPFATMIHFLYSNSVLLNLNVTGAGWEFFRWSNLYA